MKKYFNLTLDYYKRNWVSVILHVIFVALIYTYFISPTSSFEYIMKNIETLDVLHAWEIFAQINDGSKWTSWQYIVFYFLVIAITIIVFSSFIGNIQNKMRYGKTIYNGIGGVFRRTNENLFATLRAGIVLIISMEFFALLMSAVIYFAIKVSSLAAVRIILVCLLGVIIIGLMFYGVAWISCALPNMTMRNEGVFVSIKRSMAMMKDKELKVFGLFIIPLIIAFIPMLICTGFDIVYDHIILTIFRYVCNFGFYMFAFSYYIILMYVIFFDVNEIEREDLNLENKWRL